MVENNDIGHHVNSSRAHLEKGETDSNVDLLPEIVEKLVRREENRVLLDGLEQVLQIVEMARK